VTAAGVMAMARIGRVARVLAVLAAILTVLTVLLQRTFAARVRALLRFSHELLRIWTRVSTGSLAKECMRHSNAVAERVMSLTCSESGARP
jgi:hypothetical protein